MVKSLKRSPGVTMVEMLLSMAIVALLAGLSVPIYQSFQVKNDIDVAANVVAQTLHRAQNLSTLGQGDSSWGVYMGSEMILFKGSSYALRDTTEDEIFIVPSTITPSGVIEVVYTKFTGIPQSTGDIILTSSNNDVRTLTVNIKGMVEY